MAAAAEEIVWNSSGGRVCEPAEEDLAGLEGNSDGERAEGDEKI